MNNQNIAYDLEDLAKWHEGSSILTPPATLSVFGDPVKHSLSPHMHNPALHNCGIDGQYVKIRVPEVKLKETLTVC